jgi:hypothetical protein
MGKQKPRRKSVPARQDGVCWSTDSEVRFYLEFCWFRAVVTESILMPARLRTPATLRSGSDASSCMRATSRRVDHAHPVGGYRVDIGPISGEVSGCAEWHFVAENTCNCAIDGQHVPKRTVRDERGRTADPGSPRARISSPRLRKSSRSPTSRRRLRPHRQGRRRRGRACVPTCMRQSPRSRLLDQQAGRELARTMESMIASIPVPDPEVEVSAKTKRRVFTAIVVLLHRR